MQAPIKEHRIVDQSEIHNNLNLKWRKQTAKRNPKTQGTPRIKEYPKRDEVSLKFPKICRKKLIIRSIYVIAICKPQNPPIFPKFPNSCPFLFVICIRGTIFAEHNAARPLSDPLLRGFRLRPLRHAFPRL